MDVYNSKLASKIARVSLRQLQYWDEQGFVRPSVKLAHGRGTRRLYSFHDLICLKVVKDLTHYGFSLQKIRRCLRPLREYQSGSPPVESMKYVTNGEDLFVITNDRQKILDAMEGQFVMSLGIGNLVRELNGELQRVDANLMRRHSRRLHRLAEKRSGSA